MEKNPFFADRMLNGLLSIGKPLINNAIHLLDHRLQYVNTGDIGEVYVSGANIIQKYYAGKRSSCKGTGTGC